VVLITVGFNVLHVML